MAKVFGWSIYAQVSVSHIYFRIASFFVIVLFYLVKFLDYSFLCVVFLILLSIFS